uniref:Uncharacterized protein n=1 Tax=Aegilops tauschii subsp. strangulata TaxID=200361 RepID=A0A452XFZ4_AEGTS
MTCCVILHNMILEDARDMNLEFFYDNVGSHVKPTRETLTALELFFRHIRRLKMQTPTFSFRRTSLST